MTDIVPIPSDSSLGPAMRALPSDNMRRFVIALSELGTLNYTRAAAMAGYSTESNGSLRVQASRLAHDPRVIAAIHEESDRRLHAGQLVAVSNLLKLVENPMHKDHFKAVEATLNRTGHHAKSEHKVITVDQSRTDEAMIDRITALAEKLGLDATKLLGSRAAPVTAAAPVEDEEEIVEAEFEELSSEGLEDML